MKNSFTIFLRKQWHWIIFTIGTVWCLNFLLFQRGVWAFTDSGFYYDTRLQALRIALSKLGQFATTDGFYFGFDSSALGFAHLFISFYQLILTTLLGADMGQIVYYGLYYLLCFVFGLKLMAVLLPWTRPTEQRLGALFLTFNPLSLLIVTLFTIGYVYALTIVCLYFAFRYIQEGGVHRLAITAICSIYLLSYLRLIPIIAALGVMLAAIFYRPQPAHVKRWIVLCAMVIVCATPFMISNTSTILSEQNVVSSYQDAFSKYERVNYNYKSSMVNAVANRGGFTPSIFSSFYNPKGLVGFSDNYADRAQVEWFAAFQIFATLGLVILALSISQTRTLTLLAAATLGVTAVNAIGIFVPYSIFNTLIHSVLVFLYNDYGFVQFAQSFFSAALLVAFLYQLRTKVGWWRWYPVVVGVSFIYLGVNALPLLSDHYGLKKVSNIPDAYRQELFTSNPFEMSEATIFAPYHWLHFSWAPYYLDLNNSTYSKYQSLIVPNLRLVSTDFVDFYNGVYDHFNNQNLYNIALFNVKNIFVFHDVTDANQNIDTYKVVNLEKNSQKMSEELAKRTDVTTVATNEHFTHYRLPQADQYDFLVYSPKTLVDADFESFYDNPLDLSQKPLLLNTAQLNEITIVGDVNYALNSPFVSVKSSLHNANKYYVKVSVDKSYPFLLQLNQSYSPHWSVYFVAKQTWDETECTGAWRSFALTENERCAQNGIAVDLNDFSLVHQPSLKPEHHFSGNLVGNTFLITPDDIPLSMRDGDDLYLVIYFKKQAYYTASLLFSGVCVTLLSVIGLYAYRRTRKKHA